jgi:hypothetical protein
VIAQFAYETAISAVTAVPIDIVRWLARCT